MTFQENGSAAVLDEKIPNTRSAYITHSVFVLVTLDDVAESR